MGVSISKGNSKMGEIKSVSLPSVITCRECECTKKCYAKKIERLRPSVRNAYLNNLQILRENPAAYWREVEAAIKTSRFFRFHVSGDIVNKEYLLSMIDIATRNSHCEILCFTKKYETVNEYLLGGSGLPKNLHIIFSGWVGLDMLNPFNLPEAHVRFKDGFTTAKTGAIECEGDCSKCAIVDGGCWNLKNGEQVVFNEH